MNWPDGKRFAFTIFDDPDAQTEEDSRLVYSFLADQGFRTAKAVWPLEPVRELNSGGTTCGDPSFLRHCQELQREGFEIGFHNAAPHSCLREETIQGLNLFREYFGADPVTMANHYNEEAIYWGPARLDGVQRLLYNLMTRGKVRNKHFGHVPGHRSFWGDVCRERLQYCRSFVFPDIDTLGNFPTMPYYDPNRPFVRAWFTSTDGHNCEQFLKALAEPNQEKLERSGGACVMYTHFGHGFVVDGKLNPEFQRLMKALAKRPGYFATPSAILGLIEKQQGLPTLSAGQRARLQSRWLWGKLFLGAT